MRVPETDFRVIEGYRLKRLLARRARVNDPTGLKRFFVPGQEGYVRTPFGARLMRRRRAARRVAHESRRKNRG
jgi:hypothetical protein